MDANLRVSLEKWNTQHQPGDYVEYESDVADCDYSSNVLLQSFDGMAQGIDELNLPEEQWLYALLYAYFDMLYQPEHPELDASVREKASILFCVLRERGMM